MSASKTHDWVVVFRDDPAMLDHRRKYGQQHLEYLAANCDRIKIAGGLRHEVETPFVGGVWAVVADARSEVEKLVKDDPYFHPIHRRFEIFFWGIAHSVFPEMRNA
ncbi:MAG: YciI family protein [Pseudomonadota bacterium]